jgi:diacylglycerol kinase family enzyme
VSCVLFGNVGRITGGIPAFDDAEPDDGPLEVGVSTASGALQWARTLSRMALGRSEKSPFVRITRGREIPPARAAAEPAGWCDRPARGRGPKVGR